MRKGVIKMDEGTRQRLENKQLREMDTDYAIGLTEYHFGQKIKVSWLDIINYCCDKMSQGACRSRVKELLLQEVIDPKIEELEVEVNKVDIDEFMSEEFERYNYEE
jgi:hypothetical protein